MKIDFFNRAFLRKICAILVLTAFALNSITESNQFAFAQALNLPAVGTRLSLSPSFDPPLLKGIKVHADNPFRLDFILDKGNSINSTEQLKSESTRLIRYFLASLTVPEKDLWVNLSPYEKDRIIPDAFGITEMGRDLLAQDYILKQITASVIYPEGVVGKEFWSKVYTEARKKYGTANVPINTFNKVWIVPQKAIVYENKDSAYVVESRLKVLLEEDYLSLTKHTPTTSKGNPQSTNALGTQIVREVVIPILEKEVNEGKNFSQLRQVYNSLILAIWFKDKIKESLFGKAYVDQKKIGGVDIEDKTAKDKIWAQYVQAFRKGVFNFIKDDYDPIAKETVHRKYFSGGAGLYQIREVYGKTSDTTQLPQGVSDRAMIIESNFETTQNAVSYYEVLREKLLKTFDETKPYEDQTSGLSGRQNYIKTDSGYKLVKDGIVIGYHIGQTEEDQNFAHQLLSLGEKFKTTLLPSLRQKIAFLEPSSYHVTTVDIAALKEEYRPLRPKLQARIEAFLKNMPERFRAKVPAKVVGIDMFEPGIIKFKLDMDRSFLDDFGRAVWDYLAQDPELKNIYADVRFKPGDITYHISLGYVMEPLSKEEIDSLITAIKASSAKENQITYEQPVGALCGFNKKSPFFYIDHKNAAISTNRDDKKQNAWIQASGISEVRDKQDHLLAPNGKPSHLPMELWKLVRTDTFKNWFGDWINSPEEASKIVDENGEPLIVFHASLEDFTIFKKDKIASRGLRLQGNLGSGMYFAVTDKILKRYSDGKTPKIYKVFLNLRNPKVMGQEDFYDHLEFGPIRKEFMGLVHNYEIVSNEEQKSRDQRMGEINAILKAAADKDTADALARGFDGSLNNPEYREINGKKLVRPSTETRAVVVFNPESGAIKSIYNAGTFDASNPDIIESNKMEDRFSELKKSKVKAVVYDLDNNLTIDGRMTREAMEIIYQQRLMGIPVMIVSGRRYKINGKLYEGWRDERTLNDAMKDFYEFLKDKNITTQERNLILDKLFVSSENGLLIFNGFPQDDPLWISFDEDFFKKQMGIDLEKIEVRKKTLSNILNTLEIPLIKYKKYNGLRSFTFTAAEKDLETIYTSVKECLKKQGILDEVNINVTHILTHGNKRGSIDVLFAPMNKSTALTFLDRMLGLRNDAEGVVITSGDNGNINGNDYPMLNRWGGLSSDIFDGTNPNMIALASISNKPPGALSTIWAMEKFEYLASNGETKRIQMPQYEQSINSLFYIKEGSSAEDILGIELSKIKIGNKANLEKNAVAIAKRIKDQKDGPSSDIIQNWAIASLGGEGIPNAGKLLGNEVALQLALPHLRIVKNDSVDLKYRQYSQIPQSTQRAAAIAGRLMIANPEEMKGKNIIFVDDVLMSGTMVKNAVDFLYKHGANRVFVYVVASLESDSNDFEGRINKKAPELIGEDVLIPVLNGDTSYYTTRLLDYSFQYTKRNFPDFIQKLTPHARLNLYLFSLHYYLEHAPDELDYLASILNHELHVDFPKLNRIRPIARTEAWANGTREILINNDYKIEVGSAPTMPSTLDHLISQGEKELAFSDEKDARQDLAMLTSAIEQGKIKTALLLPWRRMRGLGDNIIRRSLGPSLSSFGVRTTIIFHNPSIVGELPKSRVIDFPEIEPLIDHDVLDIQQFTRIYGEKYDLIINEDPTLKLKGIKDLTYLVQVNRIEKDIGRQISLWHRGKVTKVFFLPHNVNEKETIDRTYDSLGVSNNTGGALQFPQSKLTAARKYLDVLTGKKSNQRFLFVNPGVGKEYVRSDQEYRLDKIVMRSDDWVKLIKKIEKYDSNMIILIGGSSSPGNFIMADQVARIMEALKGDPRVINSYDFIRSDWQLFGALLKDPRVLTQIGFDSGTVQHLSEAIHEPSIALFAGHIEPFKWGGYSPMSLHVQMKDARGIDTDTLLAMTIAIDSLKRRDLRRIFKDENSTLNKNIILLLNKLLAISNANETTTEVDNLLKDINDLEETLLRSIIDPSLRDELKNELGWQKILRIYPKSIGEAYKQTNFYKLMSWAHEIIDTNAVSGGINLTRNKIALQIQNSEQGVQFKFDPAMIQQLQNASGLTPVIINIHPMTISVPIFLGLSDKKR